MPLKKEPIGEQIALFEDSNSCISSMCQSISDEYEDTKESLVEELPVSKRRLSVATLAASDIKCDLSNSVDRLGVADRTRSNTRKKQKAVAKTPDLTLEQDDHLEIKIEFRPQKKSEAVQSIKVKRSAKNEKVPPEKNCTPVAEVEIDTTINPPKHGQQISTEDLVVLDTVLGEGQVGLVNLAKYKNLLVACKNKRARTKHKTFNLQIESELKFAAKLSICRNINRYIGWVYCRRDQVELDVKNNNSMKLYVLQRYVANGDARSYLDKRESVFQPAEALQASICLFSALTDAHRLGIGIVDLKLENFLIDSSGSGWLTDFGSCIEFCNREEVDLDEEEVAWTINVASPEMINQCRFSKASDVFMATLIIAELLTAELSDEEFQNHILRREPIGNVNFSPEKIHRRYEAFFDLLRLGLSSDPNDRPTAATTLAYLLKMRSVQ